MSHDTHFLQRLDRVSVSHCELALGLYNDPELVALIVKASSLPEGCDRVAISLAPGDRGPFVIVDRAGRFITCLGEGMLPHGKPLVSHVRLTTIAEHSRLLRQRLEVAGDPARDRGKVFRLMQRLWNAGERFSREEMFALYGLKAILGKLVFGKFLSSFSKSLFAIPQLGRFASFTPADEKLLLAIWQTVWGLRHTFPLLSRDEPEGLPTPMGGLEGKVLASPNGYSTLQVPTALCATWAASADEATLNLYELEYSAATHTHQFLDGLMGCLIIGLRNASLRNRVREYLRKPPSRVSADLWGPILNAVKDDIPAVLRMDPSCERHSLEHARQAFLERTKHLPGSKQFARPEEVPAELARAAWMQGDTLAPGNEYELKVMMSFLPWLAFARVEEFYLTSEQIREYVPNNTVERATRWIRFMSDTFPKAGPRQVQGTPGPNEPCSCASGKKYKKCCGAPGASKPAIRDVRPAYARLAGLPVCEVKVGG